MSFSHYAGVSIVPTLSRIVLAAAFITAGYKKVFSSAEYSLDEARKLQSWNITVTPPPAVTMAPNRGGASQWDVVTTAFRQVQPVATTQAEAAPAPQSPSSQPEVPQPEVPQATQPAQPVAPEGLKPSEPPPPAQTPAQTPVETPVVAPTVAPANTPAATEPSAVTATPPHQPAATVPDAGATSAPGAYKATAMWQIALMLDKAGWPQPKTQAWLAAFTELGGGVLLLVGLFSRVWGLGLSFVMGTAFYFTSYPALHAHGWNPNALPFGDFTTLIIQMALFVLAFGILLTGPGPLSIDRILFGGPREDVDVVESKRDRA